MEHTIKVLVVDDSQVVREFIAHVLGSDPGIRIVGTAGGGEEALEAARRHRPAVITMDVHMPKMNGVDATRLIMETCPTPIVIVSGSSDPGELATFQAIEAGALAVLRRPAGIGHPDHEMTAAELVRTVKTMSEVKVVRRWSQARREASAPPAGRLDAVRRPSKISVVALGASTGGPPVLQTILAALPKDFPAPVLIVQHMAAGFIQGFVEWLARSSSLPVRLAAQGEPLLPGRVYVAPDGYHMEVKRGGTISLTLEEPQNGLRPSVSCLMRSAAEVYGASAVAGLLSGMGRDGAEELKRMKDIGALTIVQDRDSCVVHGMPGEAIRLDAATLVLPPERIAAVLAGLANDRNKGGRDS